jgi:endonuclease/exonuclease/phosphatase family metal-dependent hydrolase
MNVLGPSNPQWGRRSELLARAIGSSEADIVALQEVPTEDGYTVVTALLGEAYHLLPFPHSAPDGVGGVLATRWQIENVHNIEQWVSERSRNFAWCGSVVADLATPLGLMAIAHHKPSWQFGYEFERERQAVRLASMLEKHVGAGFRHVIILGDFDATPRASSMRFLCGLQSLEGVSVYYQDAWETVHGDRPGHTFQRVNPLVRSGEVATALSRRIDHILVRGQEHGPTLAVLDCRLILDESVNGDWASDHFGVVADFALPDHAPGSWRRD